MRRFLLSTAAVVLSLSLAVTAEAGDKGHSHYSKGGSGSWQGGSSHPVTPHYNGKSSFKSNSQNYHLTHGTKFKGGYFYKGKNHSHWSYHCWDRRYGCYTYYCPSTCCYYYWCPPDDCYYPVDYCPYGSYCWQE